MSLPMLLAGYKGNGADLRLTFGLLSWPGCKVNWCAYDINERIVESPA